MDTSPVVSTAPSTCLLTPLLGAQEGIFWILLSFSFCYCCFLMLYKDPLTHWFSTLLESDPFENLFSFYFFIFIFWPCHTACGILVPRPGTEPVPPAAETQSLNNWTAREVPENLIKATNLLLRRINTPLTFSHTV